LRKKKKKQSVFADLGLKAEALRHRAFSAKTTWPEHLWALI
jgi:hypothetical protein